MRGDSPPRREAGARPAGALTRRALDGSSACGVANTLTANSGRQQIEQTYIPEVADPLTANEGRTYTHEGTNNFRLHNVVPDIAPALTTREGKGPNSAANSGTIVACFDETQVTHRENRSTCAPDTAALAATARPLAIAFKPSQGAFDGIAVRRLTPRECERLMGFPDDCTLIRHRGKPASDSARYAALGNSIAVPVLRWIGERIDATTRRRR